MTSKILDQKIASLYTIEQLHERSAPLFQSSLFKGRLYVDPKTGELDSANPVKTVFKKIFQGYQAGPNSPLVQMKVLQLLENVKHLINTEEDQKLAQDLAKRAGKEASRLFNSPSFQAGTASKEFFNAHQRELQPYHHFIAFTNEEVSVPKFDQQEPTQQDLFENNQQENKTTSNLSNRQQNSEVEQEPLSSPTDSISFSPIPLHNENEVSCNLPEGKNLKVAPKASWTRHSLLIGTFSVGTLVALGFIFRARLFPLPNANTIDPTVTNSGDSANAGNHRTITTKPVETPELQPDPTNPAKLDNHDNSDNQDPLFTQNKLNELNEFNVTPTADLDEVSKIPENNSTSGTSYLNKLSQISFFSPLALVSGAIAGLAVIYLYRGKKPSPLRSDKKDLITLTQKTLITYDSIIGTSDLREPYDDVDNSSYNQTGFEVDDNEIKQQNEPRRLLRWLIECAIKNHNNFNPVLEALKQILNYVYIDTLLLFQNFVPTLKEKLEHLTEFNKDHSISKVINELMDIINPNIFNDTYAGYLDLMKGHQNLINRDDDIDISNLDENSDALDHLTNPLTLLRYFTDCSLKAHPQISKVCTLFKHSLQKEFDMQEEMLKFLQYLLTHDMGYSVLTKDLIKTLENTIKIAKKDSEDHDQPQLPQLPQLPQQQQSNSSNEELPKIESNNPNNNKTQSGSDTIQIESKSLDENKIDLVQLKNEFTELCKEFGELYNEKFEIESKISLSTANVDPNHSNAIAITTSDISNPTEDLNSLKLKLEKNKYSLEELRNKFNQFEMKGEFDKLNGYTLFQIKVQKPERLKKIIVNLENKTVVSYEDENLITKLNQGLTLLEKKSNNK